MVADALSRAGIINALKQIDLSAFANAQQTDPNIAALLNENNALVIQQVDLPETGLSLLVDVSTDNVSPLVPAEFTKSVFTNFHNLSHPGVQASVRIISSKFVWKKMKVQIKQWAQQCMPCQLNKINRHTKAPLQGFDPPVKQFQHIHVDIVGPLPSSQGCTYLLTIID